MLLPTATAPTYRHRYTRAPAFALANRAARGAEAPRPRPRPRRSEQDSWEAVDEEIPAELDFDLGEDASTEVRRATPRP